MTLEQAQERAARMGLTAWEVETVRVGREHSETVVLMCVGFAGIDLPMAEEETWEESFAVASRIAFGA